MSPVPSDPAGHDDNVLMAEVSALNEQLGQYVLRFLAAEGVTKATQAIELAKVRGSCRTSRAANPSTAPTPPLQRRGGLRFCPAQPHPVLRQRRVHQPAPRRVEGNRRGRRRAGHLRQGHRDGAPVRTCPYENSLSIAGYTDVTFKEIIIPVRVFEVKTARVVMDARVEIGGAKCPAVLEYYSPGYIDSGPPSEVYVTPSDPDVHAGFTTIVNP